MRGIRASQSQSLTSSSLYEVLSVPHKESDREIKSAYRRMVLQYHPDVCPPTEKEKYSQIFLKVQEAYETLSDQHLRHDYDCRVSNSLELSESKNYLWEAQLMELSRKRSGCNSSWGSRMRRSSIHKNGFIH
ncbi:hypothetical protein SUGI_0532100 [Cryptomeria japonica]|nr:hypothetical protein SUGI_0532100 [Cryptomeria japonica]